MGLEHTMSCFEQEPDVLPLNGTENYTMELLIQQAR